jgi:hypothetical protein
LAKNGSFGFAKGRLVCRAKPNVPFVRWHIPVYVCSLICSLWLSFRVAHNVLQLGEVAEIEAQMFSFAQKFNRRTVVEFSNEPAILPNCC